MKKALITGITGMDGSHLADLLLSKDYKVFGLERHKAAENRENILHIEDQLTLIKGDLTDRSSLIRAIELAEPDEIYNMAAMSYVGDSWILAEQTAQITGVGVLSLLEAIKAVNPKIKLAQASSSEMFGNTGNKVVNESSNFYPRSPYATAKVFAHYTIRNYRESYGLFAASSICFNHEGERRNPKFVTRKISLAVARILAGKQDKLYLGTLDTKRDWGYAPEYMTGIYSMLQQSEPSEFVFATGENHTIKEFVMEAFKVANIDNWEDYVVSNNPPDMRPSEVDFLLGDASKAKEKLNWEPKVKFKNLVKLMVESDIKNIGNL